MSYFGRPTTKSPRILCLPKAADKSAAETKAAASRSRDLDAAISSITKAYGEGSIMRLGDARRAGQD